MPDLTRLLKIDQPTDAEYIPHYPFDPIDITNLAVAKGATVVSVGPGTKRKSSNSTASPQRDLVPKSEKENCPFRYLIKEWLASGRAAGLSSKTLEDYQEKVFKFWWWWDKFYASELGAHPKNVSVREARAYATYLREPQDYRWGIYHYP